MFREDAKKRSYKKNLGIAIFLALVAGMVNVVGILSVNQFTTNVTGHFAHLITGVSRTNITNSIGFLSYIISFLGGAICSSLIIDYFKNHSAKWTFIIPIIIESLLLIGVGILPFDYIATNPNKIAGILLFTMGFQNALVTTISNSVVRTTHLTGLFTDLGIEIAQLIKNRDSNTTKPLWHSVFLRLNIIGSFFIGGVIAGVFYHVIQTRLLIFAAMVLCIGLIYDSIKSYKKPNVWLKVIIWYPKNPKKTA